MVEHDSGLYAGGAAGGIDFENPRHVLGKIEDDGDVAALAGKRSAAATAKKRRAEFAAEGDGGFDVGGVARKHDADRDLAIVGPIGRIESTGTGVEANVPADFVAHGFGKSEGVDPGEFRGLSKLDEGIGHRARVYRRSERLFCDGEKPEPGLKPVSLP
jgi:hypothetical protein